MTREETLDRAKTEEQALFSKAVPNLFNGGVLVRTQGFEDGVHVRIDPGRAPISAQGTRPGIAVFTLTLASSADAGGAHLEAFGRSPMRKTLRNRRKNPNA
jgi:hypothetical protein